MFIGHWAPALLAAGASTRAPRLGTLFVAAQLMDWGFFSFGLIGVEHMRLVPGMTRMNPLDLYDMPYTHSLLGASLLALAFGLLLYATCRNSMTTLIGGAIVLSHWLLDLIVHIPDLTLAGSPPPFGLGLWNYPVIEMPLELALVIGAFVFYMRNTKGPPGPAWLLLAFMLVFQAINWFGPEPVPPVWKFYATGLLSFAVIAAIAAWTGSVRWHKRQTGLAVPSRHR